MFFDGGVTTTAVLPLQAMVHPDSLRITPAVLPEKLHFCISPVPNVLHSIPKPRFLST
jgi:hypothetical protein